MVVAQVVVAQGWEALHMKGATVGTDPIQCLPREGTEHPPAVVVAHQQIKAVAAMVEMAA